MNNPNVITIEKNVPIPELTWGSSAIKYRFMESMEVTDSFSINGNTPDFTPISVRAYVYGLNSNTDRTYTIRTIRGVSDSPVEIRIWRTT